MLCYLHINYVIYFMRAALKAMPPVLLCWLTTSQAGGCWWDGSRG